MLEIFFRTTLLVFLFSSLLSFLYLRSQIQLRELLFKITFHEMFFKYLTTKYFYESNFKVHDKVLTYLLFSFTKSLKIFIPKINSYSVQQCKTRLDSYPPWAGSIDCIAIMQMQGLTWLMQSAHAQHDPWACLHIPKCAQMILNCILVGGNTEVRVQEI